MGPGAATRERAGPARAELRVIRPLCRVEHALVHPLPEPVGLCAEARVGRPGRPRSSAPRSSSTRASGGGSRPSCSRPPARCSNWSRRSRPSSGGSTTCSGNWCSTLLEWVRARSRGLAPAPRPNTGPVAVAVRTVAGLVWMPFAFLIRFYTVVLIEPMLNPLKLPLSILFAKFIYPLLLLFPGLLQADPNSFLGYSSPLVGQLAVYLTEPVAGLLVMGTLWLLPDALHKFLQLFLGDARELATSCPGRTIRSTLACARWPPGRGRDPRRDGPQGCSCWGFHSGTVPRLYAKLRARPSARPPRPDASVAGRPDPPGRPAGGRRGGPPVRHAGLRRGTQRPASRGGPDRT